MNDLSVRLVNDASGFNSSMEEATRHVQDFAKETDKASDEVKKFGADGAKSAKDLIKEMSAISGAERNLHNYKRQLSQITKDIQDLTINYRNMSAEMKSSELGQEALAKIQELTVKAGEYKDAIVDAQQSIAALASDTAMWDGMKMGIDSVSAGLQGFVSMGILGEQSTEKLVAVIAKLKGIEAATNAVIKIGNALQKNSALMMSISTLQAKALAKAKTLEAVATGKATIAQKIFNAVAKANPYVLLATAVIGVVSALALFAKNGKEAATASEMAEKNIKNLDEAIKESKAEAGKSLAQYSSLRQQYILLSDTASKTEWIKENKKNLEELNLKINDVNDADDVFIRNADKVIKAMQLRAEASAMMAVYQEKYAEAYKNSLKLQDGKQSSYMTSNTVRSIWKTAGLGAGDYENNPITMQSTAGAFSQSVYTLTPSGVAKMNEYWRKQGEASMKAFEEGSAPLFRDINSKLLEAAALEKEVGHFGSRNGGGSGNKPEEPLTPGSLAEAQKKVQDLQTKLNNMSPDNAAFEETKRQLEEARAEVERIQKLVNPAVAPEIFPEGSLKEANHFVQVFSQQLQELDPNSDEFQEILDLLNLWKQKQKEINDLINGTTTAAETVVDKYDKIVRSRNDIQKKFEIGAISFEDAQSQIADLNKQLSDLGLTATVKLDIDQESIKTTSDKMKDFVSTMDKVGSISNAVSAVNSVYDSIKNLGSTLEEAESGWEAFFAVFETGMTIFEAVASIIEVIATVTELLSAAKSANAAATATETAATTADASAQAADAAATTTNAAAHGAAAAAEAGQSVASIPYVGPVLAIAAIAAVMAAIIGILASAKGFTDGGVIGGHSYTGDKILARVNSGELILNQHQQGRLLSMMENADTYNQPNVKFEISGSNLVGVLRNNQKKNSKL